MGTTVVYLIISIMIFLLHRPGHSGKIESVNGAMLKSLLEEESDLVVFMYREDNR